MVRHTPKPSTDPKSKSGWNTTDHSYAGKGSAELTNWARSVILLRTTKDEGCYELLLAKRDKRAEAVSLEGNRTQLLYLQHSSKGIVWEQRPKPVVIAEESKTKAKRKAKVAPKPKKSKQEIFAIRSKANTKQIEEIDGLIVKIDKPMTKGEIYKLADEGGHGSAYLLRKYWKTVEGRLVKIKNRYQKL